MSFGIRAGILNKLGSDFHLNASELGVIAATAFWGFPLAVVIGGLVVDSIGMKRLLMLAFFFTWREYCSPFLPADIGLYLSLLY
ncbi:hypothetical protein [Paraflavitalea speifideaquila]|uniref:hypothetical protein n=1 Tax=Paraflavitalea speifideaquila TaxID=3076558 RepID=UPI0028EB3744|nr:hypothetical protein [Paraflavitalea speifideiaquila]